MLGRRDFLRAGTGIAPALISRDLLLAAPPFWNKEPAPVWSPKQVEQLRTNSPWAHKAQVAIGGGQAPSMDANGSRGSFGGMHGADSNGLSDSGGRRGGGAIQNAGGPPAGSQPNGHAPEVIVRWESARPLLDSGSSLPPALAGKYAISVAGLPPALLVTALRTQSGETATPPEDREKAAIQTILAGTTLEVRGRDPEKASLLVQSPDRTAIIFGFDRSSLPIAASDREVIFTMRVGALNVSARFDPKQMVYNGELAV